MKIAIIGSGAMGSLYGGILAENGHDVYFIDVFKDHVDAINEKGLCIVKDNEERFIKNAKAVVDSSSIGVVDLAIVFVKSTITDIAVEGNRSILGKNTIVLTLQNGLGNIEKINKVVDRSQIIVGTSANGASFIEPGKIRHSGHGGTVLGEISGEKTNRIKQIHETMDLEELGNVEISDNVMSLIWEKLIVNCGINPLTALTSMKNGELLENKESEEILEEIVAEAIEVANKSNIKLSFDNADYCKEVCRGTSKNQSSMLSDVLNNRKTEIMNINGAIVRIGEELGVATPYNKVVTNLILLKEKTYKK
ncbi:MAG TPA: 2-dehydropantoate 2-reductase [Tissierellales bacterium]|nr:2-dehydropantoate 2-reductase [Tissierellales bacterium]